jgi:hypothetical protein
MESACAYADVARLSLVKPRVDQAEARRRRNENKCNRVHVGAVIPIEAKHRPKL